MARGTTLGELVEKLRIATRHDPNPALSKNMLPMFKQTLKDTQERLYDEFDWPFLKIQRDKTLSAGQRYYDLPTDLNLERVQTVDVLVNGRWQPVERGISLDHYSATNSDNDERNDPVMRWDVVDTGSGMQVEVWPVPLSNDGTLRFRGIRNLGALVANSDVADLDDQLIVLYAAGEILGGAKNPAAQLKLSQGKRRLETLQGRVSKRRSTGFSLGGGPDWREEEPPTGTRVIVVQGWPMPYVIIEDFRAGLDRRKLPAASPQGSLQTLENAHITRGGEIEKRLAMVAQEALPPGQTFGFAGANGAKYVFGSGADPGVPDGVTYQQLAHPGGHAMTGIVRTEFFDGKVFAVATYANGDQLKFYDGVKVTDFDVGSGATNVEGAVVVDLLTHDEKLYAIHSSILSFCGIDEPTRWQAGAAPVAVGYGFKNMSNQAAGSEELTALGRYQDRVAVFARRNIQIWYLDPDPLENAKRQTLPEVGTFAPKSVVTFGDIDVFFLSDSGVRSLRARDSSNLAGSADVGTPIDEMLLDYLAELTEAQRVGAAGVLEPISGRYILQTGTRAWVFSYFPSSKISAWSTYELGVQITDWAVVDGRVWGRAGDTLYQLGGDDGRTYDTTRVEVDLPYIDGRAIATFKDFTAIDILCEGEWSVYVNTDPNEPEEESEIAIIGSTTLTRDAIGMVGDSPLIKLRLVSEAEDRARLSKIVVHYNTAEAT